MRGGPTPILAMALALLLPGPSLAQEAEDRRPLVPAVFRLGDPARRAIDAAWLTPEERAARRVYHGAWSEEDVRSLDERAFLALESWRLDDPALADPEVPAALRAEARRRAGEPEAALELLGAERDPSAIVVRGEALIDLGRFDEAIAALRAAPDASAFARMDDPSELVAAARARALRARIEGADAGVWRAVQAGLARAHQELDRLYWPALIAEAEILVEKHAPGEAAQVLHDALALNPRSSEAWFLLGRVALRMFDFDGAGRAAAAIRRTNEDHPLAERLDAELRLVQDDPEGALEILERLRARLPGERRGLALAAAAAALLYDPPVLERAMARFEAVAPGSPEAQYEAGRTLAMFRQYDEAAALLRAASERLPGWTAPRLELGLLEMQTGRDDRARIVLRDVVADDPFNKRAANSLALLEEIATYEEIETDHFRIRFQDGIDRALVELMPGPLEELHEIVATRFRLVPDQKTIVEVMPDHKRFAVRITGMPSIHTIAACTGPVLAMEVPREGKPSLHHGTFDWNRVLRHEYTHTVTLARTRNRIPHWLTEAAAVAMELAPRDYGDCLVLARSWRDGTLFDLDEIKWAFVRPKRPGDRGKAYAQSHWMYQYIEERFGAEAVIGLLEEYFDGAREAEAVPSALGISRAELFAGFRAWAGEQVASWGLAAEPSLEALADELLLADPERMLELVASRKARLDAIAEATARAIGQPRRPGAGPLGADDWPELVRPPIEITDAQIDLWLVAHPDHPDLLELKARRRVDAATGPFDPSLVALLERYAAARPVDPFPHRVLARHWLESVEPARAIPHLEMLDALEEESAVYAWRLAELHRAAGELDRALACIERAASINPYDAGYRELAAAIAVQARRLDRARVHVAGLTFLEPDRAIHQRRLDRLDEMIGGG